MNIRLDQEVRIRLAEEDMAHWHLAKSLTQEFRLGLLKFNVEINIDASATKSHIDSESDKVKICLNTEDSELLGSDRLPQSGLIVDDVCIQVDKWSAETRIKYQNKQKRG